MKYDTKSLTKYIRTRLKTNLKDHLYNPPLEPKIDEQPEDHIVDLAKGDKELKEIIKTTITYLTKKLIAENGDRTITNIKYFGRLLYLADVLQVEELFSDIWQLAESKKYQGIHGITHDIHNELLQTLDGIGLQPEGMEVFWEEQIKDPRYFGISFNALLNYNIDVPIKKLPQLFKNENEYPNSLKSSFLVDRLLETGKKYNPAETLRKMRDSMANESPEQKEKLEKILRGYESPNDNK